MAENIVELLTDVADAIREKKGSNEPINAQNFADEIKNLPSGSAPRWTGHADVEGLKAIGWDDDDIAYYQQYGVNWNEEDDEYHKVSDDNKALYGVLTLTNMSSFRPRIIYLPKLDTSNVTSLASSFANNQRMVAIPILDTSNVTIMTSTFQNCRSLTCVPPLDTSKVTTMQSMCSGCWSLQHIAPLDTSMVTNLQSFANSCFVLRELPPLDTSKVTMMSSMAEKCYSITSLPIFDITNVTNANSAFRECWLLRKISWAESTQLTDVSIMLYGCVSLEKVEIDVTNVTAFNSFFTMTDNLKDVYIKGLCFSLSLYFAYSLTKDSLLYIINNANPPEGGITITLQNNAYARLAEDADIVAALEGKNITLGK